MIPTGNLSHKALAPLKKVFQVVPSCGNSTAKLIAGKSQDRIDNSIVYKIPCSGCNRSYIGETHRGLQKRLSEHQRDLRLGNDSNALVIHRDEHNHLPDLGKAEIIRTVNGRTRRKIVESIFIAATNNINIRESSHSVSPLLAGILTPRISNTGDMLTRPTLNAEWPFPGGGAYSGDMDGRGYNEINSEIFHHRIAPNNT